ncbi:MAG TPA: S24 family peptidase [Spirochaetota bacterium]|nr:S24 family peptidase [Spirochaetota bacterium]
MQEALSLSSTSVVFHHLQQLEKKGYIRRNPENPSDYQILGDVDSTLLYLNLYGMAKCGPDGYILSGDPIDRIPVSRKMINFQYDKAFLVSASGDSMEPKIYDGDLLIAMKANRCENGEIAVCVNNEKVLVKKITSDGSEITLNSLNDEYQPIIADPESFHIEGVVKGVISYNLK